MFASGRRQPPDELSKPSVVSLQNGGETCPATARLALQRTVPQQLYRRFRTLESVRRLQAGLHSFLSIRRIEARRKNASAFRLRFSQSLASLRQRLSEAMVRSTIQRLGKTTNPLT